MNLGIQRTTELIGNVDYFHDVLDLFTKLIKKSFHFKVSLLNFIKMLRLVMLHPVTVATFKHIFSLARVIKMQIQSPMTDKRCNHLSILKHSLKELIKIDIEDIIEEFMAKNSSSFNMCRNANRRHVIFYQCQDN